MIRKVPAFLALIPLAGCAGANSPDGVWVAYIDDLVEDEAVARTYDHNYVGAAPPVDDTVDEWTETDTLDESPQALFIEVFDVEDVDKDYTKVMVANGAVLTGVEEEDGTWTFSWTNSENATDTETHTSGYTFTITEVGTLLWTINVDLSQSIGTGTFRIDFNGTAAYDENDLWDIIATEMSLGQTPVYDHLEMTADGGIVFNSGDATDCTATTCHLAFTDVAGAEAPLEIRRTDLTEDEFEAVYGSGQEAGFPSNLF